MARGLIAAALILLLSGCGQQSSWTGFVYPDAGNLTVSAEIGRFNSFEQCRAAATGTLEVFGQRETGAFECGRACRYDGDTKLAVCAETRD